MTTPKKFWTITGAETTHCNDRSQRFESLEAAENAAALRLDSRTYLSGVIVLEAVEIVSRAASPVVIKRIMDYATT